MDISKLAPAEAVEAIAAMENIEQLREAATSMKLKFSGNTGEGTLRQKLYDLFEEAPEGDAEETDQEDLYDPTKFEPAKAPVKPKAVDYTKMDPAKIKDPILLRQVIRAKALRLHRVKITNLDPNDAQLSGGLVTVMNKYTGKVSKYVPYGDESENGYHIPEMLLNHLRNVKFPLRKEIKGGQFGVKKYKTTMVNKFAIEELDALTPKQLEELAAHQRASHSIDK